MVVGGEGYVRVRVDVEQQQWSLGVGNYRSNRWLPQQSALRNFHHRPNSNTSNPRE